MRNYKVKNTELKSDYYLVFLNPKKHLKGWNTLKLYLTIAEANFLVFYDENLSVMQLHPVDKDEYNSMYYNPN